MRLLFSLVALGLFLFLVSPTQAQAPAIVPGPGINPADFHVTTFATGLHFPLSMQMLSDGSLLVGTSNPTGGSFFASVGELVRLVDANGDGVADGPGTILYTGLPGEISSMRIAGKLVFVTSAQTGSERITVLRLGAHPGDKLTLVGSLNFAFPSPWEHVSFGIGLRPTPKGTANQWDVFFNVGSQYNVELSSQSVGLSGLISGTLRGESIYRVTVTDLGTGVHVTGLRLIATGLRNAAGIAFHPVTGDLYCEDNGMDTPSNPIEAFSVDELNRIPAAQIGVTAPNFGYPFDYIQYRTGRRIGGGGVQPIVVFQPIPDPWTGSESEGAVELAFSPTKFPPALSNGIFVGFHGQYASAGIANEENPVVFYNIKTGHYFNFIGNKEPNLGHPDGLLATTDSLFLSDFSVTGGEGKNDTGAIYLFKYAPAKH